MATPKKTKLLLDTVGRAQVSIEPNTTGGRIVAVTPFKVTDSVQKNSPLYKPLLPASRPWAPARAGADAHLKAPSLRAGGVLVDVLGNPVKGVA